MSPLPVWLGSAVEVTTRVGVPTVMAGVLLWFVLTRLDSALRVIMANEETRTAKLTQIEESFGEGLDRQTVAFERVMRENIKAIHENMEINRQTALATQRMLSEAHPPARRPD